MAAGDIFTEGSQGYNTIPPSENGVERKGESTFKLWFLRSWAPITHLVLSLLLALSLVLRLDGTYVYPNERKTFIGIFKGDTALRVSDVTTLISASLVAIRIAGQAVMVSTVWRCAVILLQHGILDLSQLNTMITYRIPSAWSGKHAWSIVLVLVFMFPAAYNTPIVSGSVDWVTSVVYDNSTTLPGGFGSYDRTESFWYQFRTSDIAQQELLFNALGNAALSWSANGTGQYRFIARRDAPVGSLLENVPVPYIEIHRISWDKDWEEWALQIVLDQKQILYAMGRTVNGHTFNRGNAVLFDQNISFPGSERQPATILSAKKKVAVLIGGGTGSVNEGSDCKNITELDDVPSVKKKVGNYGACWALGTVEFTTGIRYFDSAKYLSEKTVEAIPDTHGMEKVVGDSWSEYAIYMLSDMMSVYPGTRTTDMVKGNLTLYTEALIRQSYTAMRTTLYPYTPDQPDLKWSNPETFLQARVSQVRVFVWLVLNLLLPTAAIVVSWLETSDQCQRNPIVDTALAPLLTDVREILVRDTNGVSNMSYLTGQDTKTFRKLQLKTIELPGGQTIFALERAAPK